MSLKSHIPKYLAGWALIALSFAVIANFYSESPPIIIAYMLTTLLPTMIINLYERQRVATYLESKHHNAGGATSLDPRDHLDDESVKSLKQNYRRVVVVMVLLVLHYPIAILVLGNLTTR